MIMTTIPQIFGLTTALLIADSACLGAEKQKSQKQNTTYPTIGTIERHDPKLDQLIPPGAKIEKLAEGYTWAEGPVWISRGG